MKTFNIKQIQTWKIKAETKTEAIDKLMNHDINNPIDVEYINTEYK